MSEKLKVLDLFSGIGGFSLGLERTGGFETVAFCEIEKYPRKVLAKHWPDVPIYEDVRNVTGEKLAADGIAVDVITGGFPCQDISQAGKQLGIGEGTRSGLWSEIARLVGELRPKYVIVENVSALLSGPSERRGAWFGRVLGDLAELGYNAEWENIPAVAVGAPHARERVWIVAYPDEGRCPLPIFDTINAAQRSRFVTEKRCQNRNGNKMGSPGASVCGRWMDQPSPNRMAYGVSDWPHRLAACGNAVVPQIPELIGRAILDAINADTQTVEKA
jgi:DNA (cytosine-5)-methyltransferase 1